MSSLPTSTDSASPFTEAGARRALAQVAEPLGFTDPDLALIRFGENAVYRLGDDLIARVARPHAGGVELRRLVSVARWLEAQRFPAVRALDTPQPIFVEGLAVTLWRSLGNQALYGTAPELGRLLRELHQLTPPEALELPPLDPFGAASRRLGVVPISPEDRLFLRSRLAQLREGYDSLEFDLSRGLVHGDASVGNLLLDQAGTPTLIDLDGFAIGPREWDLVLTALFYDRFGWHTQQEYAAFVEAYGVDILRWAGYPVLADVREFLMVTWIAQRADESSNLSAEVARRIGSLRTGGSRRDWHPY